MATTTRGRGNPAPIGKDFMITRIAALERKYKEAMERIEALEARLDLLMGKQRGPITMTEYRLACERKDRAVMRQYLEQEKRRPRDKPQNARIREEGKGGGD